MGVCFCCKQLLNSGVSLQIISWLFLFVLHVLFVSSIQGLWATQMVLVLQPVSSVGSLWWNGSWHSHDFYATFTLAYLAGRMNFRLKVLWLDCVSTPQLEALACYRRLLVQASYSPLLEVLAMVIFMNFWKFLLYSAFILPLKSPLIPVICASTLSFHNLYPISPFAIQPCLASTHEIHSASPSQGDPRVPPGLVTHVLYFTANIPLKESTYHIYLSGPVIPHSWWFHSSSIHLPPNFMISLFLAAKEYFLM